MRNKNKIVYIIAGSNGCGKTTIAKELLKEEKNLEFLNADEIAKELNSENVEKVKLTAGKIFFERFDELVMTEKSFILETTLSGKYLVKNIEHLKNCGYKIIMIYVFVDNVETVIFRVKERVRLGGHNIPDEDIRRRFKRSQQNFWKIFRFLVDEWQLIYNGENLIKSDKTWKLVARRCFADVSAFEIFDEFRF